EAVEVLGGLHASWSAAVRFTRDALDRWEKGSGGLPDPAVFAESGSGVTRRALERMARTIRAAGEVEADDLRAEFIEPRLGFVLRDLERVHQRGAGHGHGLVGVYEVRKR
ncbi:MAG: hypothetical protein JXA90_10480, partial [Planctomycetes bacterium]|nr:hypothetical protein [Planctomycetota bacterium]